MPVVVGYDKAVADWVAARLGAPAMMPPYTAIGVVDDAGRLRGGAVFLGMDGCSVDVVLYGPRAITREALRVCFRYAFVHQGCTRVTARCRRANAAMRKLMDRLGFKYEGTQRHYWGPTKSDDAMLYGMLRSECRWIDDRA